MPRRYPPEFRARVLALLDAGRSVTEISAELGLSGQTIYNWRRQQQTDSGLRPGITSTEQSELVAARRRITQLESELAVARRAVELLREAVPPKRRFDAVAVIVAEGRSAVTACRVLGGVVCRLLRVAGASTVCAGDPSCLVDGSDRPGPRGIARYLWGSAGAC